MSVCLCVCVYIYIVCVCVCMYGWMCVCVAWRYKLLASGPTSNTYINTYIHTNIHTVFLCKSELWEHHDWVQVYTCTWICTCVNRYINTYTHIYAHTRTYIIYIHTNRCTNDACYKIFNPEFESETIATKQDSKTYLLAGIGVLIAGTVLSIITCVWYWCTEGRKKS